MWHTWIVDTSNCSPVLQDSSINSYLRWIQEVLAVPGCVQEVPVVPLLKVRRECSALGFQVELQVSMTTMQQMNYKCDAFYLEQTINRRPYIQKANKLAVSVFQL